MIASSNGWVLPLRTWLASSENAQVKTIGDHGARHQEDAEHSVRIPDVPGDEPQRRRK